MKKCGLFIIIVCSFFLDVTAQQDLDHIIETDTMKIRKKLQIVGIPIVFYTPETEFGIGGGAQFFFLNKTNVYNSRSSNILASAIYTTKNQLMIDIRPKIYFYWGNLFLDGHVRYKIFPNSFWGIGGNTPNENLEAYNQESIEIRAALLNRIPPSLNFGFEFRLEDYRMLEVEDDGQLIADTINGSSGGIVSGLYFIFEFDNRDNIFSSRVGNYMQLKAGFSSKAFGATSSFNKYIIDLRKYIPVTPQSSVAIQLFFESNFGEVPFQNKAWLGGPEKLRGYFKGRYIDDHYYAIQGEYRYRFAKRWILVGFASVGEVAEAPKSMLMYPKYSYGGGLRFQLSKKNPSLLRFDVGFGTPGNSGIYFGVNEAF